MLAAHGRMQAGAWLDVAHQRFMAGVGWLPLRHLRRWLRAAGAVPEVPRWAVLEAARHGVSVAVEVALSARSEALRTQCTRI